jgi:chromosome segregation ATPase
MFQNQQEVFGVNKYVGYWTTKILEPKLNTTPFDFYDEIPNFGRMIETNTINIDFRYIYSCEFDVKQEETKIKISFRMISKESTSQHVYFIEFLLNPQGNTVEEVKKYFDNISKICLSSQETSNIFKSELARILKENLLLKKNKVKKAKIVEESKQTGSTNPRKEIDLNPKVKIHSTADININDIDDPNIKNIIQKLKDTIHDEKKNLKMAEENKDTSLKRSNDILDRLDKDNQKLSVMEPKNEEYKRNAHSANATIIESLNKISDIQNINKNLTNILDGFKQNKKDQDAKVKAMNDEFNNMKSELNKNVENSKEIKKKIGEVEAKATVDTNHLANIEDKKKEVLNKINHITNDVQKDDDELDSHQKNLNLIQTNFNNLEEEAKKIDTQLKEVNSKLEEVKKKENDIKKQIDPKEISTLESQQQTGTTTLSDLEKKFSKKKEDLIKMIDPHWAKYLERAYTEMTNKDNFDAESYKKILKEIPEFVLQIPA